MSTHDNYPIGESKLKSTLDIKSRVIASIRQGGLGSLLASRVENPDTVITDVDSTLLLNVAEVLKPSATSDVVRWVEQHNLAEVPKEQEPIVFNLADEFGLRMPVDHELPLIEDPLVIVEGGANRTSVVRRNLAEEMLAETGGIFYQLGSPNRLIAPTRKDKDGNEIPNQEYKVIASDDICGDLEGRTVSEFDVNVASAITGGYEIEDDASDTHIVLKKGNLILVAVRSHGLKDGISKLAESGVIDGRNVVVATNGQYRTKDIIQTEKVLNGLNVQAESVTSIGDETGTRGAKIYIAELAVVLRELADS
jgi:hypothetical protein